MKKKPLIGLLVFILLGGINYVPTTRIYSQAPPLHAVKPSIADSFGYYKAKNDSLEREINDAIEERNATIEAYNRAHPKTTVKLYPYRTREMGNVYLVYQKGKIPYTIPRKSK